MNNIHPFKKLLRQKNFKNIWLSQILSQLTVNLVTFAILTQIYNTTRSSVAVSLLWLAFSLPIFLLGPFSGSLVDRFDLKRTMVMTNIFQGLAVLLLLFVGDNVFSMYSIVLVYSALDRFYVPAQGAAVPWLVPIELLPTANGLFFLTQQASLLVGFGLGGLFLSLIGLPATIMASTVFLFMAAIAATNLPSRKAVSTPAESGFKQFLTDILEGYKLVSSQAMLRYPMGLIMFLQTFVTIVAVLLPSFAFETLNISVNNAGTVLIIPASMGALVASYYLPKILIKTRKRRVIEWGLAVAGISLLLISFSGMLPLSLRLVVTILCAIGVGSAMAASMIPANTLIQEYAPEKFSGRIFGQLGFLATIASLIPLMVIASLADIFGTTTIFTFMSLLLLANLILVKHLPGHVLRSRPRI